MSRIGVVTVTAVGAGIFCNEIVFESARRNSSGEHPEFVTFAVSFDRYKKAVLAKNWDLMADIVLESIAVLHGAGADFIVIPSNTPHYAFEKIEVNSPLPVLNLIEIAADACAEGGFRRVAVLGTKPTMQEGLYNAALRAHDIAAIVPEAGLCDLIHKLIMDDLIPGNPDLSLREAVTEGIRQLKCDAVILGCTELPEIYNTENLKKPAIDTTRLLAHFTLDHIVALLESKNIFL